MQRPGIVDEVHVVEEPFYGVDELAAAPCQGGTGERAGVAGVDRRLLQVGTLLRAGQPFDRPDRAEQGLLGVLGDADQRGLGTASKDDELGAPVRLAPDQDPPHLLGPQPPLPTLDADPAIGSGDVVGWKAQADPPGCASD